MVFNGIAKYLAKNINFFEHKFTFKIASIIWNNLEQYQQNIPIALMLKQYKDCHLRISFSRDQSNLLLTYQSESNINIF